MNLMNKKIIIGFIAILKTSTATIAFAVDTQQYQLLEPIGTGGTTVSSLSDYLQTVFSFGISLAGILAVASIVVGGVQYITAYGNPGAVGAARERIKQALLGLLLAICAWLILYTINPDLVRGTLNVPKLVLPSS